MPAEKINSADSPYYRAHVAWGSTEQYVTVGTDWTPEDEVAWEGSFVGLDRDGCNRMIRALRRARDSVFGSDA